ncbi:uncharacterized protein LOC144104967 [Amblyomma americanum]
MAQAAGSAGGHGNQPAVIASTEQTITIDGDTHAHPLLVQQRTDDTKLWPSITSAHIVCYLIRSKACDLKEAEAYKSLDSYNQLQCGWVGWVLSHEAAADIVYVKADLRPSQAVNKKSWSPWACVRKNGQVVATGCSCMAGKARVYSHIGAPLWKLEMSVQKSTVDPASTQHPRPTRKVKHFASKELADHIKKSPYGELFSIPGTLLHNTLTTTRREIQRPSQAPASVHRQQATHHSEKVAFQSPKGWENHSAQFLCSLMAASIFFSEVMLPSRNCQQRDAQCRRPLTNGQWLLSAAASCRIGFPHGIWTTASPPLS